MIVYLHISVIIASFQNLQEGISALEEWQWLLLRCWSLYFIHRNIIAQINATSFTKACISDGLLLPAISIVTGPYDSEQDGGVTEDLLSFFVKRIAT